MKVDGVRVHREASTLDEFRRELTVPDGVLQWEGSRDSRPLASEGHSLRFCRVRFGDEEKPLSSLSMDSSRVHVWGLDLDLDETEMPFALAVLSAEERGRIARLVSAHHRRWFVAAHAGLRQILRRYCSPHLHVVIERAPGGKPYVRDVPSLRFSLTHSCGRALVAVAGNRDVGIDLEKIRPEVDALGLARRFLSKRDRDFIEGKTTAGVHERFLMAWVAREAVAKVDGTGIKFPLHRDYLALTEDRMAGWLVREGPSREEMNPVRFLDLEAGWVGAVSAEGTDWTVVYCHIAGNPVNRET